MMTTSLETADVRRKTTHQTKLTVRAHRAWTPEEDGRISLLARWTESSAPCARAWRLFLRCSKKPPLITLQSIVGYEHSSSLYLPSVCLPSVYHLPAAIYYDTTALLLISTIINELFSSLQLQLQLQLQFHNKYHDCFFGFWN
jgi:hypothetical protein